MIMIVIFLCHVWQLLFVLLYNILFVGESHSTDAEFWHIWQKQLYIDTEKTEHVNWLAGLDTE